MITFVYCCICLLIVCCRTTRTESEEYGYSNDSPDTLPDVQFLRCKPRADVSMMCSKHHTNKDNITWEFKHCGSNSPQRCDTKNMYKLDNEDVEWKKLDYNRKRKKLEIRNATEESEGVYRCLYNRSIMKVYVLDVITVTQFTGEAPKIVALTASSNSTITANMPLAIRCKATSVQPAEIRWFKESKPPKCDVHYDGKCYCAVALELSNSVYFNNTYHSKLYIYNSRYIDSGTYVCVVINVYDEDHKNITIKVDDISQLEYEDKRNSFSLLFLIPLILVLVPILIWLCFSRRKKKNQRHLAETEHQKQLIQPVVEFDIVLN